MVSFSSPTSGIKPKPQKRPFKALEKPRIYETHRKMPDGQEKAIWMVDGRHHDGTRFRLTCHSPTEARQKADAQQSLAIQEFRLGTDLPMAVLVAAAKAHKEGICVEEAVEFFKKNRPKSEPISVLKATEAYIRDRQEDQKCSDDGVRQMKALFKRLNEGFGNRFLHEVTTEEIKKWLGNQQNPNGWQKFPPLGDERRNTLLKTVRALYTFAAATSRGWVAPGFNPAKEISLTTIDRPDPCTMSPDEVKIVLHEVQKFPCHMQAAAYLRIFEPLRRCELKGMRWEKFNDNNVRILGKGKRKRTIQLEPMTVAWLAPLRLTNGPVLPCHLSKLDDQFRAALVKAGLRPDVVDDDKNEQNPAKNILRHTVCSFLHLLYGSAKAARLAGHSERIQESHYLGLRTEGEAKKWAELLPKNL